METVNAVIESTTLGIERSHFTFMLHLDYGGAGQGAGGYILDGNGNTAKLMREILGIAGVRKWEDLRGCHLRVKADHTKVHAIGHILKDHWLDFAEFFNEKNNAES